MNDFYYCNAEIFRFTANCAKNDIAHKFLITSA